MRYKIVEINSLTKDFTVVFTLTDETESTQVVHIEECTSAEMVKSYLDSYLEAYEAGLGLNISDSIPDDVIDLVEPI